MSTGSMKIQTVPEKCTRRDYSKKHQCYFCGKEVLKMARHLVMKHSDVPDIGNLPPVCKMGSEKADVRRKRNNTLAKYRNLGDFNHNIDVLCKKEGTFYVGRRPSTKNHSPSDYLPCQHCYIFFVKSELWRHTKHCHFQTAPLTSDNSMKDAKMDKDCISAAKLLLQGAAGTKSVGFEINDDKFCNSVISALHQDEVSKAIKSDRLIILLGQSQFMKLGTSRAGQVREKLRIIARLKLCLQKVTQLPTLQMDDIIMPEYFDSCMTAIKSLSSVSPEDSLSGRQMLNKPSLALKAGQLLKKVAVLKRGLAIRNMDTEAKSKVTDFLDLYRGEWQDTVSSIAHQTLTERRYNKKEVLPITADVVKLSVSFIFLKYCHV